MTSIGTLELCCIQIAHLMNILERATKSQKVHISNHDGLEHFITSTLLNIGPKVSQSGDRVAGICPSLTNY